MSTLIDYKVTFGTRYRGEPHPHFAPAHPDGWVTIRARNEWEARRVAHIILSDKWSGMYEDELRESEFPLGELAAINALAVLRSNGR